MISWLKRHIKLGNPQTANQVVLDSMRAATITDTRAAMEQRKAREAQQKIERAK